MSQRVSYCGYTQLPRRRRAMQGLAQEYGSLSKYMTVIGTEMGKHQAFLIGREGWIKKHNASPDGMRIRGVNELRDKQQLLSKAAMSTPS